MLRFTLTQLLMATALVGIVLMYAQSDGSQFRNSQIQMVGFKANGARIVVLKRHYRDSQQPLCYSGCLSVLDSANGQVTEVIQSKRFTHLHWIKEEPLLPIDSRTNGLIVRDAATGVMSEYAQKKVG